jgi:hypothetical protein
LKDFSISKEPTPKAFGAALPLSYQFAREERL